MGRGLLNGTFFICVLLADQLSKHLIVTRFYLGERLEVIPGFFNLTFVLNPGAAFGMFADLPNTVRYTALAIVTVIALCVIIRLACYEARDDSLSQFALWGILAGAVGNLIDRFRFDAVVDFLDFYVGHSHWPAFNVADSAISVGVFLVIIRMVFEPEESAEGEEEEKGSGVDRGIS